MLDVYIATPVLNGIEYLDETIWSIVSQQGDIAIHYHVQDGGSTDGTQERLKEWETRLRESGRILVPIDFSYVSMTDSGVYDALNRAFEGMRIPDNAFMGWLNAGDLLWPGAFANIARLAGDAPEIEWLMGWPSLIDRYGRVLRSNTGVMFPQSLIAAGLAENRHYHFVQQESTFWKKSLWNKAGGLDASFKLAGDWDLWRRFAKYGTLVHPQCNIGAFRRHPGQLSQNMDRYFAEVDARIPEDARKYRLKKIMQNKNSLAVPVAEIYADGKWRVTIVMPRSNGEAGNG
ncbi:MAG: hypothetical protein LBB60_01460 [Desulfovibrio sp.]|jgi:glycosyltransferase involved in cell wall biosynthesis|nr:hypothetical protein [Desulfovibrio sp.]